MARRLAVNVTTADEDGRMVTLMAGDEVSAAVAKGITRDDVWEDEGNKPTPSRSKQAEDK